MLLQKHRRGGGGGTDTGIRVSTNHSAIPGPVCSKGHISEPNKERDSERHNKAGLSVKGGGEN